MNNNLEVFWTFCFGLMVAISLLGNSIVIWIVCGNQNWMCLSNIMKENNAFKLMTNFYLLITY